MAQGLADDGEGDLSVAGDGGPGVASDIEGQRTGKADGAGDLSQVVADTGLSVVVLLIILYSRPPERMGRRKGEEAVWA